MSRSEAEYPAYLHPKSGALPHKTPDLETNRVLLLEHNSLLVRFDFTVGNQFANVSFENALSTWGH